MAFITLQKHLCAMMAIVVMAGLLLCSSPASAGADFAKLASAIEQRRLMHTNVSCTQCKDVVNVMFDVATNATVRAEFLADINASCIKYLPHEAAICIEYGDDLVTKLLPWIDKELETLAWDAQAVCSNFIQACTNPCCSTPTIPEKVRLSVFDDATSLANVSGFVATWTTLDNTSTHTVQWGTSNSTSSFQFTANGWARTYNRGGWIGVVHSAPMTNLRPGTRYFYRVGDALGGWSAVWSFVTLPTNAGTVARPLRVLQVGDMGYGPRSDNTVAAMIKEVDSGWADMVLHVGDVSYADGDMPHWELFLQKIEPITARIPYMTNPGNHELWYNFTAYRTQFWTPASAYGDNRMFYSFNYANAHFTQMNTETFEDTANIDEQQREWLAKDLATKHRTFTVATGHRPFYCTSGGSKDKDCVTFAALLRNEAEELLIGHQVDLVITAHKHSYERTYPVAHGQVTARSYYMPASPTYVVNGAGGNREGTDLPRGDATWSAGKTSNQFGYGRLTFDDKALGFQFVLASNVSVYDSFSIIKMP